MALVCDDKKLCTDDTCDKLKGCQYPNNTKACDDGDACTKADTCAAGSCVGTESYPAALVVASPGNQDAFRGVTALSVNNSPALAAVGEVSEGGKRHGKLLISNAEGKAVKDFPAITPQLGAGILNAIAADGAGVVAVGAMGKDDAALQNGGGLDAWFVRASATQVQTNVKLPDTGGDEMLRGVVARGDGTFWGLGNRYAAGKDQGYLPLITANGTCQVNCSTGFSHKDATGDSFQAGVALPDGGVLVFGYALGGGSKNEDGALWRFDKGGKALFVSLLGSAQNDQFFGAAGLPDGTAVGLGTSDGQGWIVRVSPEGLVSVNEQVAGTTELWSVVPHAGGFAVAGVNAQGGLLAGLDSGGLKLWQANHGKVLRGLAPIGGGFGLAGAVAGANADPQDAALLRTDAWGFASCAAAGKCAGVTQCDDGKPCTDGVCTPGAGCGFSSAANGQGCDDGAACSALDACAGGNCGAGKARLYAVNAGGTAKNDSFFGAAPAPDGGLVVAGETAHNDPATIKRILRAYWPDGSVRFQTTFAPEGTAGGASDSLHDVKAMPGGGYVVAGRTIPPGAAFSEFHSWLAYVSENGWINWSQSYPNNVVAKNPDSLSRMVVGPDGTIAAVGSYNFDTTARLLVVNRSGGVVTDTIKTAGYFKDIAAAPGGGYWIVGQTSDANVDATVTRVSSQNEWTQYKFGSVGTDESFSGVVADAGGITAFGNKAGGAQTGWVARIDNNGKLVWERLTANVYAAVVPASDGGFFAAGSMLGASGPGHVPAVFRLQTDGTAHWQAATSAAEGQWRGLALGGSSTLLLGGYTADKSVGGEDLMVGVVDNFGNPSCTASGTCLTTLPSACTDTNPCTADTCTGGKCANPPGGDGNACDDGQPCEVQDICLNGKCSPGKPLLFGPSKYGTVGYDVYNAVTSTADGGTIAVGVFGDKDGIIDRRDAAGASMWPTKLSGGAAVEFQGVAPLGGGQFVVVGSASNASPGPVIMYTMAFDSNGSKVWDHKPANKARATFLGVSADA
ncbi:MAG: hypothetical protein FJ100_21840, partial [Deltaproteobacteria bacterium]|nr:hypothetical protein [Deltaproteobacteria bacterium]